ncbi:MAG: hypothetical protein LBB82_08140 [Treponema sp.]|jgi:hypothetical protein|nr:hypothetical protein [Treponema sp.]
MKVPAPSPSGGPAFSVKTTQKEAAVKTADARAGTPRGGTRVQARTADPMARLLASLNLPGNAFSRSLVSAARFFSLPLDKSLLQKLKTAALNQKAPLREAALAAAASAAAKGLELPAGALERYAAAVAGETGGGEKSLPRSGAADGGENGDSAGGQNAPGGDSGESGGNSDGGAWNGASNNGSGGTGGAYDREQSAEKRSAADLKRRALKALEAAPLLDGVNRIPGKDGKRWAVIPLAVESGGLSFKIVLRILLLPDDSAEKLSAGISVCGPRGEERRWFISLGANRRGELAALPPAGGEAARELAAALQWPPNAVRVKEYTPFADIFNDLDKFLPSVDEAV